MDAAAEIERNPVSKHQIQPESDAGQDGQTRPARPNSQAREEMFIFPVPLTSSMIGNFSRLVHTLLYVMAIYTYQVRISLFCCICTYHANERWIYDTCYRLPYA